MPDIIPFSADVLTRVRKYVKAPGLFVCGGEQRTGGDPPTTDWVIHYKGIGEGSTWGEVFGRTGAFQIYPYCGAYGLVGANPALGIPGTPTYIMAGLAHRLTGNPDDPGLSQVIFSSTNGVAWTETRRQDGGFCYAAGFDQNTKIFYVQAIGAGSPAGFSYQVLSSPNGGGWSVTNVKTGQTGFSGYADPLLMATGNPLVKDGEGNIVPNGGYYGSDGGNIIIAPKQLAPYYESFPGRGADNNVEIIKKKIDPDTGKVTITRATKSLPIEQVTCTAFAGGVWKAAGWNGSLDDGSGMLKIATSTDNGDTWKIEYSVGNSKASCLMGGS